MHKEQQKASCLATSKGRTLPEQRVYPLLLAGGPPRRIKILWLLLVWFNIKLFAILLRKDARYFLEKKSSSISLSCTRTSRGPIFTELGGPLAISQPGQSTTAQVRKCVGKQDRMNAPSASLRGWHGYKTFPFLSLFKVKYYEVKLNNQILWINESCDRLKKASGLGAWACGTYKSWVGLAKVSEFGTFSWDFVLENVHPIQLVSTSHLVIPFGDISLVSSRVDRRNRSRKGNDARNSSQNVQLVSTWHLVIPLGDISPVSSRVDGRNGSR
ncbi:hypothetical protein AVEN_36847-1 [Araneus ventricosus]|uniref:Uncharacterized protein n=1 Tax=Araneus ventricosus TaxID=182803 RepID=A0A4Y2V3Y9_ARAVE|nr:hypothetical protein AVEN_36847-1 [Araneus ventricosus]